MAAIRSKDTRPELRVRSALHRAGYRFRLHRREMPGTPDLVLPRYRAVVFVHGCFWHGHGCKLSSAPKTNVAFWRQKMQANRTRDIRAARRLRAIGWSVLTVWQCHIDRDISRVLRELASKPSATHR